LDVDPTNGADRTTEPRAAETLDALELENFKAFETHASARGEYSRCFPQFEWKRQGSAYLVSGVRSEVGKNPGANRACVEEGVDGLLGTEPWLDSALEAAPARDKADHSQKT